MTKFNIPSDLLKEVEAVEEHLEALKLADYAGFAARREEARKRNRLRGIGIANAIERAASPGLEYAEIRFNPSGTATVLMGSKNQGQGHETIFRQIVNERLGLDPREVRYIDGDTERVAFGIGSMGSRSTCIGGTALWMAADKVIAKGRKIAASLLEAAEPDIEFEKLKLRTPSVNPRLQLFKSDPLAEIADSIRLRNGK